MRRFAEDVDDAGVYRIAFPDLRAERVQLYDPMKDERSGLEADGREEDVRVIEMQVPEGQEGRLYWGPKETPIHTESQCVRFALKPGESFQTYGAAVGEHDAWRERGTVYLRLHPADVLNGQTARLRTIRLVSE